MGESGLGQSTWSVTSPIVRVSPYGATAAARPASAVAASSSATPPGGSASRVTSTSETVRRRSTPATPSTWSAWKWVITSSGTRSTPSRRRQPSTARGSGPASTTTALSGPARRASASPWPTSHAAKTHPDGDQPGVGGPTRGTTSSSRHAAAPEVRCRSTTGPAATTATVTAVRRTSDHAVAGQSSAAPGRAAPCSATVTIHPTHQPASVPSSRPSGSETRATTPPSRPSTVAGPTTGATTRLATTATRLTCPEIAATNGVQASWAAAGTATASASQRGSHRARASRHDGATSRIPAVARTDSANPAVPASSGSRSSNPTTAAPRPRRPRCQPPRPSPISATVPIAAARTTLGSVRASSTNPTIPPAPTRPSQRPRTPPQRATTRRKPTTSVRLVPDTAVRWVRPVVRKSSVSSRDIPESSPSTRAGTKAAWAAGRWATESRIEARSASVARQAGPGLATRTGGPRGVTSAATSRSSAGASRPVKRTRSRIATRCHSSSPKTSTGWWRPTATLTSTRSPNGPGTSLGSLVTVPVRVTRARSRARPATGPSRTAFARATATTPTPPPTSDHREAGEQDAPARGPAHGRDDQQR